VLNPVGIGSQAAHNTEMLTFMGLISLN